MFTKQAEVVTFSLDLFDMDVVKRAAYRLGALFSVSFDRDGQTLKCWLSSEQAKVKSTADERRTRFEREVLDQDLRRRIAEETAGLRNAILALAFSRTGLQGDGK